ncbi:MAG: hypothetical protein ABI664_14465, partial [bacterium]
MTDAELAYVIRVTSVISLVLLFFGISSYFSPDAWTTYEVANSIGRDFYRANTAREYSTGSLYSSAFPPVWPVIVAGFTRLTGNIYGSYLAAFLAYIGFAIAAEQFGRRAFGRRGIGLLSAILISQFLRFRSELGSGRERPLMLLELSVLGSLLIDLDNASRVRSAVLGFLAGLMVMTRFDALPAALTVLIAAPFIGVRRERILFMLGGFLVAISPWIFFSYEHFGVSFASSNKWTAISIERGDVYDYHMVPPRTL